jgi:hypothetical protein
MYINVADFDTIMVFILKVKKGMNPSKEDFETLNDIYVRTITKYQKSNKRAAKFIAEKRKTNKNYGR